MPWGPGGGEVRRLAEKTLVQLQGTSAGDAAVSQRLEPGVDLATKYAFEKSERESMMT